MEPIGQCLESSSMMMALLDNVISKEEYDAWVLNYFNQEMPPPPKSFSAEFIRKQINYPSNNCGSCVEVINLDSGDVKDNSDIAFNVIADPLSDITRYYSITLFNAFFAVLDPVMPIDSFGFTKASKASGDKPIQGALDIIFEINFKNQKTTYWDLSGTVPPVHK